MQLYLYESKCLRVSSKPKKQVCVYEKMCTYKKDALNLSLRYSTALVMVYMDFLHLLCIYVFQYNL